MFKWLASLFGFGGIDSVESIMAPLVKTRDKLVSARDERNTAITNNVQRIRNIEQENIHHAGEAALAATMVEGLNAQLKPLDALKNTEVAKRG